MLKKQITFYTNSANNLISEAVSKHKLFSKICNHPIISQLFSILYWIMNPAFLGPPSHSEETESILYNFHSPFSPSIDFIVAFFEIGPTCLWCYLMQPSMGNLNLPFSRVASRRRILRCIIFGIGESPPSLYLDMVNLYLMIFEAWWILNENVFYCFFILINWKWILTYRKKQISLVNLHPTLLSWPNCFGKEVNWWWILNQRFC